MCYAKSLTSSHFILSGERLHDLKIEVFADDPVEFPTTPSTLCAMYEGPMPTGATENILCSCLTYGRYLRIEGQNRQNPDDRLTLCEVETYSYCKYPKDKPCHLFRRGWHYIFIDMANQCKIQRPQICPDDQYTYIFFQIANLHTKNTNKRKYTLKSHTKQLAVSVMRRLG